MRTTGLFAGAFAVTLALSACGGGGSGSTTFDLMVAPPGGSNLAATEELDVPFLPLLLRDFTLPAGIAVMGQVTDGTGAPLTGAEVSFLSPTTRQVIAEDSTDASGNYSLMLPSGGWDARVDSGSSTLGFMELAGVSIAPPGPVTVDLPFPALVPVSGSVFEDLGPAIPVAGISFMGSTSGAQVDVVCDGGGFYSVSLVPDAYEVVVTPAGASALTHLKERFPGVVVSVPAGALDFSLMQGVQVSGTVLDASGLPLQESTEIDVILLQGSTFFPPATATTNPATGAYSIGPVPTGSITFRSQPPGDSSYPYQDRQRQVVGPTAQTEDFMLSAGFILSGTVLRSGGAMPEENVEVVFDPLDGSLPPRDDKTTAAGAYETSLFPGTYDVTFTPEVANAQLPETRRITIAGDMTLDLVLTLGALVSGTVTQPGGLVPAPEVRVEITGVLGASAVTNSGGQYSFLAPAGTHTLTLVAEGGLFEDIALAPVNGVVVTVPGSLTQDIEIAFATTGRTVVSGMVFQADGATPAVGAEITAIDATGEVIGRALAGPGGSYLLVIP